MAKRTNKKNTKKKKTTHPRLPSRGWLFLRKRWVKLLNDTFRFFYLYCRFYVWVYKPKIVAGILILVGLSGVGLWINRWWSLGIAERVNRAALLDTQLQVMPVPDLPHPTHLFIQWFIDTDIKDGTVVGDNWTVFEKESVYIVQSARPGQPGNIVIYGHNTREVMGNIRALKGYEKIKMTLSDGTERFYQVKRMQQVSPTAVSFLEPTSTEILTLYTCDGLGDTKRFVVQAIPVASNEKRCYAGTV